MMKGGGTSSSQRTDIDYFTKSGRAILDIASFFSQMCLFLIDFWLYLRKQLTRICVCCCVFVLDSCETVISAHETQ